MHHRGWADLLWAIERGDIRHNDNPTLRVRRDVAGGSVDHATDLLAIRCDHLLVRAGLAEISALDIQPPQPSSLPSEMGPWESDDPRIHTTAYASGMRVLRAAMSADVASRGHDHADDDPLDADWARWPMDPGIAMFIPPPSDGLVAPRSVQAAMHGPEWGIRHGWRAAAVREVTRVEGFNGWRMVSGREMRDAPRPPHSSLPRQYRRGPHREAGPVG